MNGSGIDKTRTKYPPVRVSLISIVLTVDSSQSTLESVLVFAINTMDTGYKYTTDITHCVPN